MSVLRFIVIIFNVNVLQIKCNAVESNEHCKRLHSKGGTNYTILIKNSKVLVIP